MKLRVATSHREMARGSSAMERRAAMLLLLRIIYFMELLAAILCTGELVRATAMLVTAVACKKMHGLRRPAVEKTTDMAVVLRGSNMFKN